MIKACKSTALAAIIAAAIIATACGEQKQENVKRPEVQDDRPSVVEMQQDDNEQHEVSELSDEEFAALAKKIESVTDTQYGKSVCHVTNITKVEDAEMYTDQEAIKLMAERGFLQEGNWVKSDYGDLGLWSIVGRDVEENGETRRPIYYLYYTTEGDNEWIIQLIGKNLYAYRPLAANNEKTIMYSESKEEVGYYDFANVFYTAEISNEVLEFNVFSVIDSKLIEILDIENQDA